MQIFITALLLLATAATTASAVDCKALTPPPVESYTGECKDGLAHGQGQVHTPSKKDFNGYYIGTFVNGDIHGESKYIYSDGSSKIDYFLFGIQVNKDEYDIHTANEKCNLANTNNNGNLSKQQQCMQTTLQANINNALDSADCERVDYYTDIFGPYYHKQCLKKRRNLEKLRQEATCERVIVNGLAAAIAPDYIPYIYSKPRDKQEDILARNPIVCAMSQNGPYGIEHLHSCKGFIYLHNKKAIVFGKNDRFFFITTDIDLDIGRREIILYAMQKDAKCLKSSNK